MLQKIKRSLENAIFCMILACVLFSIMGAAVKVALREVPVYEAVFFRSSLSALFISLFIFYTGDSFIGKKPLLLTGRGLAGFVALNLNFYAISKISLGDATILNQTSPLFVALFSGFFFKEKLSKYVSLLSLLSFVGVALIVKPTFANFHFASFAGLLGGLVAALAYITISHLHESDSSLTMAFYFTAISSLLSLPWMIHHTVVPTSHTLVYLMITAITGTFAQLFLTHAYKNEYASWVAPFSYVSVPFSFALGVLYFSEIPDSYSIIGSAIVITCCILLILYRQKGHRSEASLEILE